MESRETKPTPAPLNGTQAEKPVDTIRELLFGDRIRQFEERFSLLDQTVQSEHNSMREVLEKKIANLQGQFQEQLDRLKTALETEKQSRAQEIKRVSEQLQTSVDQLRQRLEALSNEHQTLKQDSQREMLSLSKKLFKEIQDSSARLNSLVDSESTELRQAKVDRRELAGALTNVAALLSKAAERGAPPQGKP